MIARMEFLIGRRLFAFDRKAADIIVVAGPGQVRAHAGGANARYGIQAARQLCPKTQGFKRLVSGIRQRHASGKKMFGTKAGVGAQQVHETAQHQAGANQQQAGQAYFAYHQGAAQPEMPAVAAGAASTGAQIILHIGAGCLQSRRQAK